MREIRQAPYRSLHECATYHKFYTLPEAIQHIQQKNKPLIPYKCDKCAFWHVGEKDG